MTLPVLINYKSQLDLQCQFLIHVHNFPVHDDPERTFLIKKLDVFNFATQKASLFRFRVHRTLRLLMSQDYESARWCFKHKHGLLFKDYRGELNQRHVPYILRRFANFCNLWDTAILYKGPQEEQLLKKSGCKLLLNINQYKYPGFDLL